MQSAKQYRERLLSLIRSEADSAKNFTELVRRLKGAHPTLAKELLSQHDPKALDRLLGCEPARHNVVVEHHGNPTLNSWYFSSGTNDFLGRQVDWTRESVGLLGTPGILIDASEKRSISDAHLFDLEPPVFLASERGIHVHAGDIDAIPSGTYDQKFDSIFIDAPWYVDDALRWSAIAMEWLKPKGRIFLALWPQFLRPTAPDERKKIVSFFGDAGADVQAREQCLEYEVPSFEAGQLVSQDLPFRSWKLADLITASFPSSPRLRKRSSVDITTSEWREVRANGTRFFLQWSANQIIEQDQFLISLGDSKGVLLSPSMRSPRANANVLSSVGHGLSCSDNSKLMEILGRVSHCGTAALTEGDPVDSGSLKILKAMLNDEN